MIRLAVIGTHWITDQFIEASHAVGAYCLTAVYSRDLVRAQEFAHKHNIRFCFDSLTDMAASSEIDAVYIASPNALHYSQAELFLNHKKHVICEKPLCSTLHEAEQLIQLAKQNQVVLFEALKTYWHPNYFQMKTFLPRLGKLRKAFFQYCQYSSCYPAYLAGENPNTFNPEFSNGSVMDIGVYCIAAAVALWGLPQKMSASACLLSSGVDAHGTIMMNYGDFDVTICHSKVSDSYLPSEIQGEAGALKIDHLSYCERLTYCTKNGIDKDISLHQHPNSLYYGAYIFAKLIHNNCIDHLGLRHTLNTSRILTEVRKQTGVCFPADQAVTFTNNK